jgi:hypothetical protein
LVKQPDAGHRRRRNEQRGAPSGHQVRAETAVHTCRRLARRGSRHSPELYRGSGFAPGTQICRRRHTVQPRYCATAVLCNRGLANRYLPTLLPEWIMEWCPGGIHGLWGNEFGVPASVESDVPALAVHDDVMVLAKQAQIG